MEWGSNFGSEKVRFYFNCITGEIEHTDNKFFILNEQWKYIDVFLPNTKIIISATVQECGTKWSIKKGKLEILSYSMTEPEIQAYKDEVVRKITQILTK